MKLRYLIIPLACTAALWAQTLAPTLSPQTVSVDAKAMTIRAAATSPLLGYTLADNKLDLRAILGKAGAPSLGDKVPLPLNTRNLYLAPRGLYALLSKTSSDDASRSLTVWTLHPGQPELPISGVNTRPDIVAFSPRGSAAALYSQTGGHLQIVTGLPLQPITASAISLALFGSPSRLVISDDGLLVLAAFSDGRVMLSKDHANWSVVPANFFPAAWTFLPGTHDLAVTDTVQQTIILLTDAGDKAAFHILAQGLQADHLAIAKDGSYLAAANTSGNTVWTIALKDGAVSTRQTPGVQQLATLRDGFSLLLGTVPSISIVTVTPTPVQ